MGREVSGRAEQQTVNGSDLQSGREMQQTRGTSTLAGQAAKPPGILAQVGDRPMQISWPKVGEAATPSGGKGTGTQAHRLHRVPAQGPNRGQVAHHWVSGEIQPQQAGRPAVSNTAKP